MEVIIVILLLLLVLANDTARELLFEGIGCLIGLAIIAIILIVAAIFLFYIFSHA